MLMLVIGQCNAITSKIEGEGTKYLDKVTYMPLVGTFHLS